MKKNIVIKRLKKGLMFIVILVFFIIGSGKVFASSEVGYTLIENHYSVFTLSGIGRLFYLKIYEFNGKVAYCIELGKNIPDNIYENTSDFSSLGYSDKVIEYINLISYYGYEYPTHRSDYKYYMAAQELIWEYLSGIRVEWTDELSFTGRRVDVESYKEEILDLVSKDSVIPSIEGESYTYEVDDDIMIEDLNDVLYNYEIYDNDGLKAYIEGNKLIIDNDGSMVGDFDIRLRKKLHTDGSGYIYYNDVSQKLYTSGDVSSYEFDVNISISGANLVINKLDSHSLDNVPVKGGSLAGAKYGLYDRYDNLVHVFETDNEGKASYSKLAYGDYYLVELEPSLGYRLDETVYEVKINQKDNEFSVYEDYIETKLEIFKTYDLEYFESDVVFEIYDEEGSLYDTLTTDNKGYGFLMLPFGVYEVRQINSKEGYEKVLPFVVVVDLNTEEILTYYLDDRKIEEEQEDMVLPDTVVENPKTLDNIYMNFILVMVAGVSLIFILMMKFFRSFS